MIKSEEALKALFKIKPTTNDYYLIEQTEKVDDFIKQYLTPTFGEVVNAWLNCDYDFETKFETEDDKLYVMREKGLFLLVVDLKSLEWNWYGDWIDGLTHEAINLTIRYAEGKKEKENGK